MEFPKWSSWGERIVDVGACCVQLVFWKHFCWSWILLPAFLHVWNLPIVSVPWEFDCVGFCPLAIWRYGYVEMMWGIGGEGFLFSFLGYRRGIARVLPETRELSGLVLSCLAAAATAATAATAVAAAYLAWTDWVCTRALSPGLGLCLARETYLFGLGLHPSLHLYLWLVASLWLSLWWNLHPIAFFWRKSSKINDNNDRIDAASTIWFLIFMPQKTSNIKRNRWLLAHSGPCWFTFNCADSSDFPNARRPMVICVSDVSERRCRLDFPDWVGPWCSPISGNLHISELEARCLFTLKKTSWYHVNHVISSFGHDHRLSKLLELGNARRAPVIFCEIWWDMEVAINGVARKSSILVGFSIMKKSIFGYVHIDVLLSRQISFRLDN